MRAGGVTSSDVREERYKIQSALFAATSAIEEGCVLGGGQILFRASKGLNRLVGEDEASNAGVLAISLALQQPVRILIENAKRSATHMMAALEASQDEKLGFDADSGNLADLENKGILDSAKALRVAIGIAFSHARKILETGAWDLSEPGAENKPS